jgi:hypothetical protein
VIAILVLLIIKLISLSCTSRRVAMARYRRHVGICHARSRAAALTMMFVSVSVLPNGNRTIKELRIGLGVAALLDVIIGGSGFFDRPGRPARAPARAFELGPVA